MYAAFAHQATRRQLIARKRTRMALTAKEARIAADRAEIYPPGWGRFWNAPHTYLG